MRESKHDLLVRAYQAWVKVARDALKKVQGHMSGITHNMIDRLEEDLEAGRDPLPRLKEIYPRLLAEFDSPTRYGSSYRFDTREQMARLEAEIVRLESEED